MKVIETAWQDYVHKVLPAGLPPESVQFLETKKAFYAGAGCLLDGILKVLGPGQEPTESDLLIMNGIQEELAQFVRSIRKS